MGTGKARLQPIAIAGSSSPSLGFTLQTTTPSLVDLPNVRRQPLVYVFKISMNRAMMSL